MYIDPSGFSYGEYYLYSIKQTEMASVGSSYYVLAFGVTQNAPIIITSSGYLESRVEDPWARIDGLGKYQKLGFSDFSLLPDGSSDLSKKEFTLDPHSSGTIIFSSPLMENVFIEYETAPSGYYIMSSVDLNPMRGEVESGFIHFANISSPENICLSYPSEAVYADGYNFTRLTATVLDSNLNKLSGIDVYFSLPDAFTIYGASLGKLEVVSGAIETLDPSGNIIKVRSTTNNRGEAKIKYIPFASRQGKQVIRVEDANNSSIYALGVVDQFAIIANPFVLDESELDSYDYLS
jgi:hypothetical protein